MYARRPLKSETGEMLKFLKCKSLHRISGAFGRVPDSGGGPEKGIDRNGFGFALITVRT